MDLSLGADSVAALFATMLVLSVVPGPSDVAIVSRALASGFRPAAMMVTGIMVADLVFIVVAVYGLAMLANSLQGVFVAAKYLCGGYLIWLGVAQWRAGVAAADAPRRTTADFSTGLLITFADPKAILFYMGLLPAFVDLSSASHADALAIMAVATAVILGVKLTYAGLADRASALLRNTAARQWLNRVAGALLCGIGVYVVMVV